MVDIRMANEGDLDAVAAIYEAIHAEEEAGRATTGWLRGVYPTANTAREAFDAGALFVLEEDGVVAGAARVDRTQVDVYAGARWSRAAAPEEVMVLHTLVIDPARAGRGLAHRFVAFYESYAASHGCRVLRMDTNEKNAAARGLYKSLGYREADTRPCEFNGIPDVRLVLLEKEL
ncbi:MAG: GNAT family N-acetyltransferase [Clostridiales bacterium]|nr:GNAT family N-acetyltransferase [Clostridiales bacterium]